MKNKRFIAVIILDLLVFVCMCLGVSFSIFHVRFMGDYPGLVSLPLLMTFTGLSNVFVGLVCLACALYRLIRKEYSLPFALFIIKLLAVAEISITFIITATYLSPSLGSIWWRLYLNNNLFNHFITPVLAIVSFVVLEEKRVIKFPYSFLGTIPVSLYGIMYTINVYTHLDEYGNTDLAYDIYGLMRFGVGVFCLFVIGFFTFAFIVTAFYRFIKNKKE